MEGGKSYYSIRDVSKQTGLTLATLRFWEKSFPALSPRKDGHGSRYYTPDDIALIRRIQYIRDELKITRIEAIQRELDKDACQSDVKQRATDILLRVRDELVALRDLI